MVAHLVGEPEPGVPDAERAVDPGGRGPRAERHLGARPRAGHRASSPSAAARPATPRSSPASSASRAWSASPASWRSRPATFLVVDGETGDGRDRRRPRRGRERGSRPAARRARRWPPGAGPAETSDGTPDQAARQRRRRAQRRTRERGAGAGRRPVPHRAVLPQRHRGAVGRGAGRDLRPGARRLTARGSYVVVRTLDAGSDKPIAFATHARRGEPRPRRPRAAAVASATPA